MLVPYPQGVHSNPRIHARPPRTSLVPHTGIRMDSNRFAPRAGESTIKQTQKHRDELKKQETKNKGREGARLRLLQRERLGPRRGRRRVVVCVAFRLRVGRGEQTRESGARR